MMRRKAGRAKYRLACTGTVMRDYIRCTDFSRIPEEIVSLYADGTEIDGELVYVPKTLGGWSRAS